MSGLSFRNNVAPMSVSKKQIYQQCHEQILTLVEGESDEIARMASVVGVLHHALPHFFWTGFYRRSEGGLVIGPYQGSVGCLRIKMGKGVCGTAAETEVTQVVEDVSAFPGHIACDENSRSEIVVPVFKDGVLIAVFDVDSTEIGSFDETDQECLESLLKEVF